MLMRYIWYLVAENIFGISALCVKIKLLLLIQNWLVYFVFTWKYKLYFIMKTIVPCILSVFGLFGFGYYKLGDKSSACNSIWTVYLSLIRGNRKDCEMAHYHCHPLVMMKMGNLAQIIYINEYLYIRFSDLNKQTNMRQTLIRQVDFF